MEDTILTNRELATLILLGALMIFVLIRPGRSSLGASFVAVLQATVQPKVLGPLVLFNLWILLALLVAGRLDVWNSDLWKASILWMALSGFGLVFSLNDAIQRPDFFRTALLKAVGASAIVEFVFNVRSFQLWIELMSQVVAVGCACVAGVMVRDSEDRPTRTTAVSILCGLVVAAFVWAAIPFAQHWGSQDWQALAREFLLPIWLTPVALAFVYLFAVVAAYDQVFRLIQNRRRGTAMLRLKAAIVLRGNANLAIVRVLLPGAATGRLAECSGFLEAWKESGVIRSEERAGRAAQRLAESRSRNAPADRLSVLR